MSAILHLGKSITSGSLGVKLIQPYLDRSGELCISSSCISSLSSVHISSRKCHRSVQTYDSSCIFLQEGLLASLSSLNMLEHISHQCSIIRNLIGEVSVDWVHKVLSSLHLTFWPLNGVFFTSKGSLPQSVRQGEGFLSIYNQRLLEVLEVMGRLVCLSRFTKQC